MTRSERESGRGPATGKAEWTWLVEVVSLSEACLMLRVDPPEEALPFEMMLKEEEGEEVLVVWDVDVDLEEDTFRTAEDGGSYSWLCVDSDGAGKEAELG